jgi:hypothetical protein
MSKLSRRELVMIVGGACVKAPNIRSHVKEVAIVRDERCLL